MPKGPQPDPWAGGSSNAPRRRKQLKQSIEAWADLRKSIYLRNTTA